MKKNISFLSVACFIAVLLLTTACKSKPKEDTTSAPPATMQTDTMSATVPSQPAVTISPDDSLTDNVKDATKDFPGVTATVNNGEIMLTGDITRDKLPKLMMSLNSLHPKKITNNLTIK